MSLLGRSGNKDPQQEVLEENRRRMLHQNNLSRNNTISTRETDFLREIIETPAEAADAHLENLKSKDIPLANFNKAEVHKLRWDLEYLNLIYEAMHPPPESHMVGEYRKFLMDDPLEGFGHLRSSERLETEEFMAIVNARATRGRDGFQQKQNNTDISISETREQKDDEQETGWLKR